MTAVGFLTSELAVASEEGRAVGGDGGRVGLVKVRSEWRQLLMSISPGFEEDTVQDRRLSGL